MRRLSVLLSIGFVLCLLPGRAVPAQDDAWDGEEDLEEEPEAEELGPIEGVTEPPESGLEGGRIGYELSLSSTTQLLRGRRETLAGMAYEVRPPLGLRATAGLAVEVVLLARAHAGDGERLPPGPYRAIARTRTTTRAGGVFTVELDVPDAPTVQPLLVLRVGRPGRPARRWVMGVAVQRDLEVTLLSDRVLYEAGETIHGWALVRDGQSQRPSVGRRLIARLGNGAAVLAEREVVTGESGAVVFDFPIAEGVSGGVTLSLAEGDEGLASRAVTVGTRHLERMRIAVGLERELLDPGEALTGLVSVVAADSTPISDAEVELRPDEGDPVTVFTDARGEARFSLATPSYLSGDSRGHSLEVVARHAAHGSATASASYTSSRVPYFVSLTPEAGELLIDAESDVFVAVTNALGEEARAGLGVEIAGAAVVGGRARITTDAHGLGRVRVRVPRTAVARAVGGDCAEELATELVATVLDGSRSPREARLCARVSETAIVLPRLDRLVVAPGASVEVSLLRAPANRTPVLIELLQGPSTRLATIVPPNQDRASLTIPTSDGWLEVRARPLSGDDTRGAIDEPGATWVRGGGTARLAVRPDDAFALSLSTDRPSYVVRQSAHVSMALSTPPSERAWATLLVRDEAWHAGEEDYALHRWIQTLRELVRSPTPEHDLALRYAFAELAVPLAAVRGADPVLREPWDGDDAFWTPADGVVLDALDVREALVRTTMPEVAAALEAFLLAMPEYDEESIDGVLETRGGRTRFSDGALQRLEELGLLQVPEGLGGRPLTARDLDRAGFGFSFDVAAARVARTRLVTLLGVLAAVGSSEDPALARVFSVEPPERWLALAVHHGLIDASALVDPWGRPFAFRRASRPPALVISERAPNHELLSPGPDGRLGTGDDVRDPFARTVPEGTLWAERSGENDLIAALSRIAPGPGALTRMVAAYRELGLAAADELVPSAVYAYASEEYVEGETYRADYGGEVGFGAAGIGTIGHGGGSGSGYGYGTGSGGLRGRSVSVPTVRFGTAVPVAASALARVIREEFPATLFFVGEVPFDAAGRAELDVALADAVTTYRIEAIAWSSTGWRESAMARITVDQPVQIDAPLPEVARVGDALIVPLRIVNRGASSVRVTPRVVVEEGLGVELDVPGPVEVPPMDGVALRLAVRATAVGPAAIRVEAEGDDGERLDAVRRRMIVRADARRVESRLDGLLEPGGTLTFVSPDAALEGTGDIRLWAARTTFGDLPATGEGAVLRTWADRVLAGAGMEVRGDPERVARLAEAYEPYFETPERVASTGHRTGWLGFLIGAAWREPAIPDPVVALLLRDLSDRLGRGETEGQVAALIGIAPVLRHAAARADLAAALEDTARLLRDGAANEGARASDAPDLWARVAAALTLAGQDEDVARVDEMLRRLERHTIRLRARGGSPELAWIEGDGEEGGVDLRVAPTAWLATTLLLRGDAAAALPLARSLVTLRAESEHWPSAPRALAGVVLALTGRAPAADTLTLRLDGAPLTVGIDGRSFVAEALGLPGSHAVTADLPSGTLAFASLSAAHLVAWDAPPAVPLRVDLGWSGEVGPRDTRTALWLEIRSRSARVITRPVVEIQLPTGAELDVEARQALSAIGTLSVLDGSIQIELPPLGVGRRVLLPLRARLTLAGTLRGLGVTVHDRRGGPGAGDGEHAAILPARALEVPESGPEPAMPERTMPGAFEPVPLPIDPLPIELVYALAGL